MTKLAKAAYEGAAPEGLEVLNSTWGHFKGSLGVDLITATPDLFLEIASIRNSFPNCKAQSVLSCHLV